MHSINTSKSGKVVTVENARGRVVLRLGGRYRVEPYNPKKLKFRGRTGTIESFDDVFQPHQAWMRFEDNNRRGLVQITDLVESLR